MTRMNETGTPFHVERGPGFVYRYARRKRVPEDDHAFENRGPALNFDGVFRGTMYT